MGEQNYIPESAVESAHCAVIGSDENAIPDFAFDALTIEQVRRILEAAAPRMCEAAFERGWSVGYRRAADSISSGTTEASCPWCAKLHPSNDRCGTK